MKLLSSFPEGRQGLGLAVLRGALALELAHCAFRCAGHGGGVPPLAWVCGALAAFLLFGILSPLASGISAVISALAFGFPHWRALATVHPLRLAALSIAVFLLGPGAFSLDARLFGRRVIVIPARRKRP